MNIEELREKVEFVNKYRDRIEPYEYAEDVTFLLEQNQQLAKELDEARKEWREMFSKSSDVLLALYTLNLCCPDPETMEFEWEDGKEDYIDAINLARSLL